MEEYFAYLKEKNAALLAEAEQLRAADRTDESSLAKVRANIYEICGTVTKVHMDRPGGGPDACRAMLARFRKEWGASLEKAEAHGDTQKAVIEKIKLEALGDAEAKLEEALQ